MFKRLSTEFLFVLYLFVFVLLRPIFYYVNINSTLLLILFDVVVLILYCFKTPFLNINKMSIWLMICGGYLLIFCVQKIISPNSFMNQYLANFVIYTIMPLLLLQNVKDFGKVLLHYYHISILVGILICFDPLFEYRFTGDYMQYGFNMLMFSYAGLLIGVSYFKKRILWIPIAIELVCIAFWGNKGALLASVVLLICVWLKRLKKTTTKLFFIMIGLLGVLSYDKLILTAVDLAKKLGINSYSMTTFEIMLSENANIVYDARLDIWREAIIYIKQSPFFGGGIATFEEQTGGYAHNVFLDIALTFGIVGLIVFICILIHSIVKLYKSKNVEVKLFQGICFGCWFVSMQFSLTFWNVTLFWAYWGMYLYGFLNEQKDSRYGYQKAYINKHI